jgi:hypothetical protein
VGLTRLRESGEAGNGLIIDKNDEKLDFLRLSGGIYGSK